MKQVFATIKNALKSKLVAILLLAALLRLALLFWGFPYIDRYSNFFHCDEQPLKNAIQSFPRDIVERTDLRYPTGYPYLLAVILYPLKILYTQDGQVSSVGMNHLSLLAKLMGVAVSLMTVALVYRFTVLITSRKNVGLVAAGLLALVTISVNNATYITTDTFLGFLFTLFVYLVVKIIESRKLASNSQIIALGAVLGFLVATKYTGGIAVLATFWFIPQYIRERQYRRLLLAGVLFAAVALVVFFIAVPTALIKPAALWISLQYEFTRMSTFKTANYSMFAKSYV